MIRPGACRTNDFARREKRRVRPAAAERHAEPLRVADHRVRAHLARRRDERQRQQIGGDRDQRRPSRAPARSPAADRRSRRDRPDTAAAAPNARDSVSSDTLRGIDDLEPDVERLGAAAQHVERLRIAALADEEHALARRRPSSPAAGGTSPSLRPPPCPRRGATPSRCPCAVRSRTTVWKVQQRFEAALRDLGLIRRVRRVPARDSRRRSAGSRSA